MRKTLLQRYEFKLIDDGRKCEITDTHLNKLIMRTTDIARAERYVKILNRDK